MSRTDRGIIYLATQDDRYRLECCFSILSLRDSGYDGPVTVLSDSDPSLFRGIDASVVQVSCGTDRFSSRALKTSLASITPYQETLYLDCDTIVMGPISGVWDLLAGAGLWMARDVRGTIREAEHGSHRERKVTKEICPPDFPQYNGGVVLWRNDATSREFFQEWKSQWEMFRERDQGALSRAIRVRGLEVGDLPKWFNFFSEWEVNPIHAKRQGAIVWHNCGSTRAFMPKFPSLFSRWVKIPGAK